MDNLLSNKSLERDVKTLARFHSSWLKLLARAVGSAGSRSSAGRFEAEQAGAGGVVVAQAGIASGRAGGGLGGPGQGAQGHKK